MNEDSFPISAMDSLGEYVKRLKVVIKGWTLRELVEVRDKWENQAVPRECLNAIKDEIFLRDNLKSKSND